MTAATPSPEVRAAGDTYSKLILLRPLRRTGAVLPWTTQFTSWAAHGAQDQGIELLVADRFPKTLRGIARIEEDARALCDWPHPNLAMVRDVIVDSDALIIVTDFIEAERLDELRRPTGKEQMPLEVGLRILVDVLAALSALHGVRKGLVHGHVVTSNILVGHDGIARLARGYLGGGGTELVDPMSVGYLAPEILRGDDAIDPRADVYSAGVLLWETLTQRRLYAGATKDSILGNLGKPRPKATPPPSATWAVPLVDVADKALSSDPAGRYATTAEMAAAVRLIVRARLAMPPKVAAWVDKVAGTKIIARRSELGVPAEQSVRHSRPSFPNEAMRALDAMRPPSRPPRAIIPQAPPEPRISNIDELESGDLVDAPDSRPKALIAPRVPLLTAAAAAPAVDVVAPPPLIPPPVEIATPEPAVLANVGAVAPDERSAETERRPRRRRGLVAAVLGLAVLVIAIAGIKLAVRAFSGPETPSTTAVAPHDTPQPTPSPTPTPTPEPTPAPTPADSTPPAPTDTATAPASTFHPHPKPKSTYDPMGI